MNLDVLLRSAAQILPKLPLTLMMMLCALSGGLLLGLILAIVRIRRKPISNALATLYISFMRCTPTLVQLFLVFYGLPKLIALAGFNINGWNNAVFAVIALALHSAAILSEVIRSAYLSVGTGQQEAAYAVGMTYWQSLKQIILPQAFRLALPNLGNASITIFKETSLAFSIGVVDIMGYSQMLIGNHYGVNIIEVYVFISILYWLVSIAIGRTIAWIRNRGAERYPYAADKAA